VGEASEDCLTPKRGFPLPNLPQVGGGDFRCAHFICDCLGVAGLVSLGGVSVGIGFVVYVLLAAFGITALLFTVPLAYDALRIAGALYLGWIAWNALRPGGASPFQLRNLAPPAVPRWGC
jgi:hypothetical protein